MRTERKVRTALCCLFALALCPGCTKSDAASQDVPAAADRPAASEPAGDPISAYRKQCLTAARRTLECEVLRGLIAAHVAQWFDNLEEADDQRGVQPALTALGVVDEPEVLIAAMRVLGGFADTPGIREKVMPLLLESPYFKVEEMAAQLLSQHPDAAIAAIGNEWLTNHGGAWAETPWDEVSFPERYEAMRFPDYRGMERYPPGDSNRSVGWWTPDPPATVARQLEQILKVKSIGFDEWSARRNEEATSAMGSIDESKMAEVQKLADEFARTQNMAILEKMQTLQQQIYAPLTEAGKGYEAGVNDLSLPAVEDTGQIFYLIAEEKGGHVARLVMVYRQPALDRTVLQMMWDLRDYPPAWGEEAEEQ